MRKEKELDKVERNYFEFGENGELISIMDNMIKFSHAFLIEFIYEKCKKDFYSNPRFVFLRNHFTESQLKKCKYIDNNTIGYYQNSGNKIIINLAVCVDQILTSIERLKDKIEIESYNKLVEAVIVNTIIHELLHSVEYNKYKDINNYEVENTFDAEPKFFNKYSRQLDKYLGYNIKEYIYLAMFFLYDSDIIKLKDEIAEDHNYPDMVSTPNYKVFWNLACKIEQCDTNRHYRKSSMYSHLIEHVLCIDKRKNPLYKDAANLIFKQDYTLRILFGEHQNFFDKSFKGYVFTKDILTNPYKYMKRINKLVYALSAYNDDFYYDYPVRISYYLDKQNKNINILFNLESKTAEDVIQYK